jgi:hypothetical protein
MATDPLLQEIRDIDTVPAEKLSSEVDTVLAHLRSHFTSEARQLGKAQPKAQYERLKETAHAYYTELGLALDRMKLSELSLRCYLHVYGTIDECKEHTNYPFDHGFEFFNAGLSNLRLDVYERGVSLIELADVEDKEIKNVTGAAVQFLKAMMEVAWNSCDEIASSSYLLLSPTRELVARMNESEKYRLFLIVLRTREDYGDYRGYITKDELERNLGSIAKLTEAYLRRRLSGETTLASAILQLFPVSRYPWRRTWQTWLNGRGNTYLGSADDAKIGTILTDTTSSTEDTMFKLLCLMRNFTAHMFNDQSVIFKDKETYRAAFRYCLTAFLYSVNEIM